MDKRKKQTKQKPTAVEHDAFERMVAEKAQALFVESSLVKKMQPVARMSLCRTAICTEWMIERLTKEKHDDVSLSEEVRTLTSLCSAKRKAMQDLGLTDGDTIDPEAEAY